MWPPQKLKGYLSDLLLFFWLLFVRKRASVLVRSRMGLKVTTRNQPCCNFSDRNLVRQKSLSSSSSTNLDDCNFTPIELLNHHDFLLSKFNELNRGVISYLAVEFFIFHNFFKPLKGWFRCESLQTTLPLGHVITKDQWLLNEPFSFSWPMMVEMINSIFL